MEGFRVAREGRGGRVSLTPLGGAEDFGGKSVADLNFLVVTGRATKDPIPRRKYAGLKVEFSIEVERPFTRTTGEPVSDMFLVDVWGPVAQECLVTVRAGTLLLVIGTLNKETFTRLGEKEHLTVIKARHVRVLSNTTYRDRLPWEALRGDAWDEGVVADYLEVIERLLT